MPKTEIDYSNTIIYKITCKDTSVTDVYVGHTTNFVQRKHAHKQSCNSDKTANHKCKLYDVIRNNGGWLNWQMEIIHFLNCHDHYEARQKEQEYFILLNATLNSIEPMPKPKPKEIVIKNNVIKPTFYCDACEVHCDTLKLFEIHNLTNKHTKKFESNSLVTDEATLLTDSCPKVAQKYSCQICEYFTSKKSSYDKHLITRKHLQLTNVNNEITGNNASQRCSTCNKEYKSRVGLWKHNKTCIKIDDEKEEEDAPSENMIMVEYDINQLTNLVIEVVKNNSDFQKQMLDMCKNMQSTIISNSNCNNNNINTTNNFNLQVFLNEYCKDAMNISDFIDSFDLQVSDLENVGRLGYIEGMSNIIISKINELEVNKRPIHCSDLKREIVYIKDDDVWEREDADNTKFRRVIKKVTGKNIGTLSDWRNMYPDCMDIESDYNEIYLKLIKAAIGPNDTVDNETKIMKKVVKHVVIDKKMIQQ